MINAEISTMLEYQTFRSLLMEAVMLRSPTPATWKLLLAVVMAGALSTTAASSATALEIGKPAPDFSLPGTNGETVSLRQFLGKKVVLLEFFGAAFAPV